ncbi:MAG: hypothetical protein D084_Lepto4C00013G0002 [Leptospirillum sp. Group IV 'UBA BS']|nr:MAG: hypothetical protein D084_Lepto4C00013G0002 [Leptospirillum sp. Group IV 'UBA BS']
MRGKPHPQAQGLGERDLEFLFTTRLYSFSPLMTEDIGFGPGSRDRKILDVSTIAFRVGQTRSANSEPKVPSWQADHSIPSIYPHKQERRWQERILSVYGGEDVNRTSISARDPGRMLFRRVSEPKTF